MTTLPSSDVDAILAKIKQGCSIQEFPIKGEHASTENDRYIGCFIFIPVMVAPNDDKKHQRQMGKRAAQQAESATDGMYGVSAAFHQDPNEPMRGTITIRKHA